MRSTKVSSHFRPLDVSYILLYLQYDYDVAVRNEERLLEASLSFEDMEIVKIMKEIVPEFKSQHSKYEVLDK